MTNETTLGFQLNPNASLTGTSRLATFDVPVGYLVRAFGEPVREPDDKTTMEWDFTDLKGNTWTIYNYKGSRWSIGGHPDNRSDVSQFVDFLREKTKVADRWKYLIKRYSDEWVVRVWRNGVRYPDADCFVDTVELARKMVDTMKRSDVERVEAKRQARERRETKGPVRSYGWGGFHSQFHTIDGGFFAQADDDQSREHREFSFKILDDAHNFCLAAVDPKHANHRRIWEPERRALDDIKREGRASLKDWKAAMGKSSADFPDRRFKNYLAGFAAGHRDCESGIECGGVTDGVDFRFDDGDWRFGYRTGREAAKKWRKRDARLEGREFASMRSFSVCREAFDSVRSDVLCLLAVLTDDVGLGERNVDWGSCGTLAHLREELRIECSAMGLMEPSDDD